MTATVVERPGRNREGPTERAADKLSTVGTRTGSEAGSGGRAGDYTRSPTVTQPDPVEPGGARGKSPHGPGEIRPWRGGRKSAEVIVAKKSGERRMSEGPKERPEPTTVLGRRTRERTKQQGVRTTVATLDWLRSGRRLKAPNRSECSGSPVCAPGKEDLWADQPPDAENRTSGGVGGCRGAIPGTRPDQKLAPISTALGNALVVLDCGGPPPLLISSSVVRGP